jgi:tRNA threonylcarbamoyladenosine biosynthesis protein TsaE
MAESEPLNLVDADATRRYGARLAAAITAERPQSLMIYLLGELGAGKTTLARGLLEALGHGGRVPSPTYTLIEPYELAGYRVYHIDLYRIRHARELDELDIAGQLAGASLALIEWPDHGAGHLPNPDLRIGLQLVPAGRMLVAEATSAAGHRVLDRLRAAA